MGILSRIWHRWSGSQLGPPAQADDAPATTQAPVPQEAVKSPAEDDIPAPAPAPASAPEMDNTNPAQTAADNSGNRAGAQPTSATAHSIIGGIKRAASLRQSGGCAESHHASSSDAGEEGVVTPPEEGASSKKTHRRSVGSGSISRLMRRTRAPIKKEPCESSPVSAATVEEDAESDNAVTAEEPLSSQPPSTRNFRGSMAQPATSIHPAEGIITAPAPDRVEVSTSE